MSVSNTQWIIFPISHLLRLSQQLYQLFRLPPCLSLQVSLRNNYTNDYLPSSLTHLIINKNLGPPLPYILPIGPSPLLPLLSDRTWIQPTPGPSLSLSSLLLFGYNYQLDHLPPSPPTLENFFISHWTTFLPPSLSHFIIYAKLYATGISPSLLCTEW